MENVELYTQALLADDEVVGYYAVLIRDGIAIAEAHGPNKFAAETQALRNAGMIADDGYRLEQKCAGTSRAPLVPHWPKSNPMCTKCYPAGTRYDPNRLPSAAEFRELVATEQVPSRGWHPDQAVVEEVNPDE